MWLTSTYNLIFARDSLKRMMASSCRTVMGIAAALPVSWACCLIFCRMYKINTYKELFQGSFGFESVAGVTSGTERNRILESQLIVWKCPVCTCLISTYLFCSISAAFSESRGLQVARQYSMYLYIKNIIHKKPRKIFFLIYWYAALLRVREKEAKKIKSSARKARRTTPFQPIFSFICFCVLGWSSSTTGMHLDNVACYSLQIF